jgi:hypothetical protein
MADVLAEVQIEHLMNTSQERYHYTRPIGTFRPCLTVLSPKYLGDVSFDSWGEKKTFIPGLYTSYQTR